MMGVLLALYPRDWRQRYEAEYREVLTEIGLSWRVVLDLVRGAVSAHTHHQRLSGHRMPAGEAVLAVGLGTVAWLLFVGGWSDIFKQSTFAMEWVVVQVALGFFAALSAVLWLHRLRALAVATLGVVALALACQWGGVGPIPGWRTGVFPLQVSMVWFAGLLVLLLALAVHAGRGALNRVPAKS